MHPLIPYLRRQGADLTHVQIQRIMRELNELDALRTENAELKAQIESLTAPAVPAPKGRKESAA